MLFLSLQVFIFPNILICYKSIPLKWAHMGTWLFLKLCGWDWSSFSHSPSCLVSSPSQTSSSFFCVSQGRVKHIHENMPKNAIEPSPKFDSHLSKSANRVTSLLSYRAFELTQVNTGPFSFAYSQSRPVCWKHSQIRCVGSLSYSNIFLSLRLMRSRPGPGTCVPTLWCPFSIRERKLQ